MQHTRTKATDKSDRGTHCEIRLDQIEQDMALQSARRSIPPGSRNKLDIASEVARKRNFALAFGVLAASATRRLA